MSKKKNQTIHKYLNSPEFKKMSKEMSKHEDKIILDDLIKIAKRQGHYPNKLPDSQVKYIEP